MQPIGSDGTVEQMMWGARLAGARLVLRICERAHNILFILRRLVIRRNRAADFEAPRINWKLFGSRLYRRGANSCPHRACDQHATPKKRASINQAISGNFRRQIIVHSFANTHDDCPPWDRWALAGRAFPRHSKLSPSPTTVHPAPFPPFRQFGEENLVRGRKTKDDCIQKSEVLPET